MYAVEGNGGGSSGGHQGSSESSSGREGSPMGLQLAWNGKSLEDDLGMRGYQW